MLNVKNLPPTVLAALYSTLQGTPEEVTEQIINLSPPECLDIYLQHIGVIGKTEQIILAVFGIDRALVMPPVRPNQLICDDLKPQIILPESLQQNPEGSKS